MEHIFNDKPFFAIQFDISGCAYDFRVNDAMVYYDADGGPMQLTYPANSYINSDGTNSFSVILFPMEDAKELVQSGKKCMVKLSLLGQSYQHIANYTKLSSIEFSANPEHLDQNTSLEGTTQAGDYFDGLVKVGKTTVEPVNTEYGPGVKITQTVTTPKLNVPHWAWFNGEKISDNPQAKQELLAQYQKIYHAIQNTDYDSLEAMMKLRVKTAAESTYQTEQEMDVVSEIHHDLMNKYRLVALQPEHMKLRVMGDGRLAKLYYSNNNGVIMLEREEQPKTKLFDFKFSKINGKWVVTN